MVNIISEKGYPQADKVLARLDYYIDSSCEGGILIIGKNNKGKEYKPKIKPYSRSFYVLPSGTTYSVPIAKDFKKKNYPALYFPFQLDSWRWNPNIVNGAIESQDFNDEFFNKFDLTLMNESMQKILLDTKIERIFKEIAVWGAYELKGLIRNYFWGEMYCEKTPALEDFLEIYRG